MTFVCPVCGKKFRKSFHDWLLCYNDSLLTSGSPDTARKAHKASEDSEQVVVGEIQVASLTEPLDARFGVLPDGQGWTGKLIKGVELDKLDK